MKKSIKIVIAALTVLTLAFGLCACGGPTDESKSEFKSKAKECSTLFTECTDLLGEVENSEYYDDLLKATPNYEDVINKFYDLEDTIQSAADTSDEELDAMDQETMDENLKALDTNLKALKTAKGQFQTAVDQLNAL